MEQYYPFLRRVYFFKDLTDDEVALIARLGREATYAAGEVIFRETSPADKFYIVLDGTVEVWKNFETAGQDWLAEHGAGHLFGEMSLIDDLPRSASIVAKTDARVLYLPRDDFNTVLTTHPNIALSLLRSLSAMVRKSNESFVEDLRRRNEELESAYRKLQEAQEELLRAERFSNLGKFSSMILHDIRNPISVLKSYGEMILMNAEAPDRVRTFASGALKEADRLNFLANELLDYSKGEIRLNMSIVELDALLERLREYVGDRFEARNVELVLTNNYKGSVILDEERMLRVLINLAENARKATGAGGRFSVDIDRKGELLRITVADNGEGMPPAILNRVFEPFFSSSGSGGTGLGMVIVKNIVEAHRGELSVESAPGVGTTIRIVLPLHG